MELLKHALDFFLHLDKHLADAVPVYGGYIYAIVFGVIFCETGLVITPVLPGDSLLFTVGALTAVNILPLPIGVVYLLLTLAALLGDHSNYWIGRYFGPNVFGKLMNRKYLDKTHEIYEKHGVQTLVIFQFAPFFRTFAPFVAGVGKMTYGRFTRYNLTGVLLWTTICVFSGYFFGNLEVVKKNFELVILGIVFVSLIPTLIQVAKHLLGPKAAQGSSKRSKKK